MTLVNTPVKLYEDRRGAWLCLAPTINIKFTITNERKMTIAILEARFYNEIADQLAEAAIQVLENENLPYERIAVPGCFELPAALSMATESEKYAGFICLGCVIRGETSHYDYVCGESARGINEIAMLGHAVGYGIITAENRDQANMRADAKQKNVGGRAAEACVTMMKLQGHFYGH